MILAWQTHSSLTENGPQLLGPSDATRIRGAGPEPTIAPESRIDRKRTSMSPGRDQVNGTVLALSSSKLDSTSNTTRARARARNRKGGAVMADQIFDHEELDVYGLSIEYAGETFRIAETLSGLQRHSRDQ